jgi:hypothetical protein
MKYFSNEWHTLINNFVFGGIVAIKVNDDVGPYFQMQKGLRQVHPLSPMLFNMVVDMLGIIIEGTKVEVKIEEVLSHLLDGGLSILQYADDMILLWNMILRKQESKINLITFVLKIQDEADMYAELFGCDLGQYLGIRIHYRGPGMPNGNTSRIGYKSVLVVGKKNYYPWEEDLFSLIQH